MRRRLKTLAHKYPRLLNGVKAVYDTVNQFTLTVSAPRVRRYPLNTSLPFGLNFLGYFRAKFSIGEQARTFTKSFDVAHIPYALNTAVPVAYDNDAATDQQFQRENPYLANLMLFNPHDLPGIVRQVGRGYFPGHYNIGMWAWELPQFPRTWMPSFHLYHEVWVFSDYVREAVARVSPVPVRTVTHPMIIDLAAISTDRARLHLPPDVFIFLFTFDFISRVERKNPGAVLEAFRQAFGGDPRVRLVIKYNNAHYFPDQMQRLQNAAAGLNVQWLDAYLSRQDMLNLIACSDCYVSLHRAEGLGLGMAEAMYLGKPVIATGYSGNLAFMTPHNSFPVRHTLTPVPESFGYFARNNAWADPDVAHAAELMQYVVQHPDDAAAVGVRGAQEIRAQRDPAVFGREVSQRLQEIARNTG